MAARRCVSVVPRIRRCATSSVSTIPHANAIRPARGRPSVKIGVAGQVVIGPAGAAGTFSAPLRITVTRVGNDKPVFSQTYRAEATTDGVRAGQFRIVTDPINLPMPTLQLADLYSITVGFEGGTGGPSPTARKVRRKRAAG